MSEEIRVVETLFVRKEEHRRNLWTIYEAAFQQLNEKTPIHHGGYTEQQFDAILQDEDFGKFLVYVGEALVGATLLTNVLTKIPWVNAAYFEKMYPNRYRDGKIFFLPAVVIQIISNRI